MRYNTISDVQIVQQQNAFIDAAVVLLQQASRTVRIRSALLDPSLFDSLVFNEALSAFARKSRFSEVMILIDYPNIILQRGGPTLNLARRLSDKITFRHYFDAADEQRDSLILTDQQGILVKPASSDSTGYFSLTDKVASKELNEQFLRDWQLSPLARELRQLAI